MGYRTKIAAVTIVLATATFGAHLKMPSWSMSFSKSMTMASDYADILRTYGLFIQVACLLAIYGLPLTLGFSQRDPIDRSGWPLLEFGAVALGDVVRRLWLSGKLDNLGLLSLPDLGGAFLAYLLVYLAYSFAAHKAMAGLRATSFGKALVSGGVAGVAGLLIYVFNVTMASSWRRTFSGL